LHTDASIKRVNTNVMYLFLLLSIESLLNSRP